MTTDVAACPTYLKQKQIRVIMAERNIPYREAYQAINKRSYSTVLQSNNGYTNSVSTQLENDRTLNQFNARNNRPANSETNKSYPFQSSSVTNTHSAILHQNPFSCGNVTSRTLTNEMSRPSYSKNIGFEEPPKSKRLRTAVPHKMELLRQQHKEIITPITLPSSPGGILANQSQSSGTNLVKIDEAFVFKLIDLIKFIIVGSNENRSVELDFDKLIDLIQNRLNINLTNLVSKNGSQQKA